MLRVYRKRQDLDLGIFLESFLDPRHLIRHPGANIGTTGKKEIHHRNVALKNTLINGFFILIYETKIRNKMLPWSKVTAFKGGSNAGFIKDRDLFIPVFPKKLKK